MKMFINGTALTGGPDHANLRGAPFLGAARTAPEYRFYSVRDEFPGLVHVGSEGATIVGELYELPAEVWRTSLQPKEPPELELGNIKLSDGQMVKGMILMRERVEPQSSVIDITEFGGWRAYQAASAL